MKVETRGYSPMMEKYFDTKEQYKDCLLFYRLGDFYELFFDDAKVASKILDIALTGRNCGGGERAPMCGVPYHAVDSYIAKLIEAGYKVAICEQMSEPVKGQVVEREVTRVITPGTVIESEILEGKTSNYIMCIFEENAFVGASFCDVSTGEFKIVEYKDSSIQKCIELLSRVRPAEIICNQDFSSFVMANKNFGSLNFLPKLNKLDDYSFSYENAEETLKKQFNINSIIGHDFEKDKYAIRSAGALINYLLSTQKRSLSHINKIVTEHENEFMHLDYNACRNLELIESVKDKKRKGSLLGLLNKTSTAMGLRLLEKWIYQPLQDVDKINNRLDCVEELFYNNFVLNDIIAIMSSVNDIARTCSKISFGTIMPKECIGLKNSLYSVIDLANIVKDLNNDTFKNLFNHIEDIKNIADLLNNAFIEEAPNILANGGYIKESFNQELFDLRNTSSSAKKWMDALTEKERTATGIKNLKIGYSRIIGYYIEINKSQESMAPYRYTRKQTIANHERFVTEELKEIEEKLLNAQELSVKLEATIFNKIKDELKDLVKIIQDVANDVAYLDVISAFAQIAQSNQYVRPIINKNIKHLKIIGGRHPIVEANLKNESFVANDTYLDDKDDRTMIITGPNMAGKSTYMRQIALIVLMAHMGCFVPAKSVETFVFDRIFTRIGASDDLNNGQSTFMVEMTEVANILNNATSKSLVLLDEVGRGTATYDGMSIAWAVLEYISTRIKCKTLFSTHYHEITTLEGSLPGVKNYKVSVKEFNDSIIFLRKVVKGTADKSFGIEVASLSGIYDEIILRAKKILQSLEKNSIKIELGKLENQKELNYVEKDSIINKIKNIDINSLTPIEAFEMLVELNKSVNKL